MRPLSRVVAVAAGAAVLASAAPAGAEPRQAPVKLPAVSASRHTLTLITGDVVDVQTYPDGRQVAAARPGSAGRPQPAFKTVNRHGDLYVIPETARPMLAADRLDQELFNVTDLIAAGYDDAHRASLPLIVSYGEGARRTLAAQPVPAGAHRTRLLPSAGAAAVERAPAQAVAFWKALGTAGTGRTAAPAYSKVWLDRPVRATLETSVPQIGAPAAWQAGYDGKGVKVAVLDTGADTTHPDLKDRVAASANFSDAVDTVDHHGHGTHVAATIAGSGAAAEGRRKGVAPGASLYIGKVLNDQGSGSLSWIIAGMEWAAGQDVDVVSMSLGTNEATDGRDPMSQALNNLSAESDALFVVAAGNAGPDSGSVSSPGSADAALTVGAVDKADGLAEFSSRGPRAGDDALKPEVSAPGVGIVAARAEGTSLGTPVDARYTSLNGTSMATPHVAGAAALLAQRHPDWTAGQLKASLVSTAKPVEGAVDAIGSGRVDVGRAVTQQVYASPAAVSMPTVTPEGAKQDATVEIVNSGTTPVTLALALDVRDSGGKPAADGLFALSADRVEVPAGGKASVVVTADPAKGTRGRYTGRLRGTADGVELSVAVVQTLSPVRYPVEIPVTYRDGGAPGEASSVDVLDLDTGEFRDLQVPEDGRIVTELPAGRYSMMATLMERRQPAAMTSEIVFAGDPDVEVTGPATVPIDARSANRVRLDTARPVDHSQVTIGHDRWGANPEGGLSSSWMMTPATERAYLAPIPKAEVGQFEMYHHWDLYAPVATARTVPSGKEVRLIHMDYGPKFDGRRDLPVYDGGTREDFTGVDLRGKLALLTFQPEQDAFTAVTGAGKAGASVVVLAMNEARGALSYWGSGLEAPSFTTGYDEAAALRKAGRVRLEGTSVSPYWYDVLRWHDSVPRNLQYEISPKTMTRIDAHYHGTSDEQGYGTRASFRPNAAGMMIKPSPISGAMEREEWTTPGDLVVRTRFQRSTEGGAELITGDRTYQAGRRLTEHWFAPGGPGQPRRLSSAYAEYGLPAQRTQDTVRIMVPEFGDSDPDHFGFLYGAADQAFARLYRGDTLIGEGPQLYNVTLTLPAERASYRLEQTSARTAGWWGTATKTATAWTFSSAHTDRPEVLPLLKIDYELGVDLRNAVPARGGQPFAFTVRPPTGAVARPVKGATAQISYDDGATWTGLRVDRRDDGRFTVRADHKGRTGHASLRVTAWDSAGAKVEQTITRAFALK
ncbi:S8 family serine peptidase [Streptosporangium sp. NBC_01639]|uniref:S8 family peptidase n=1 Tax=Streptosporangium sp. NBC_01639 TaxID=2975948 RepID=UPI0038698B7F|nr:S8 family serine peptidase [Streptosporangium sp. NBC_01639]